MPRFFFDIDDSVHLHDQNGTTLTDLSQVEAYALRMLADIARYKTTHRHGSPLNVTVRDAAGGVVYRATMTIRAEWVGAAEQ